MNQNVILYPVCIKQQQQNAMVHLHNRMFTPNGENLYDVFDISNAITAGFVSNRVVFPGQWRALLCVACLVEANGPRRCVC